MNEELKIGDMTLEDYKEELDRWHRYFNLNGDDPDWEEQVIGPWFQSIGPQKAEEYGIDCWLRLGAKALMVDINAVFYRWKRLFGQATVMGSTPAMLNALRDAFGYCIMYCVILRRDPFGMYSELIYEPVSYDQVLQLNETLIYSVWERDDHAGMHHIALNMAYNMWRNATP